MTASSSNWLSAMALRLNEMHQEVPIAFDWRQSLLTIQLRVVGFGYHRDQFLDLQARTNEADPELFDLTFRDQETIEPLTLDAALAGSQLWAASQALHNACDMLLRVFDYTQVPTRQPGNSNTGALQTGGRSRLAMKKLRSCNAFQYLAGFVAISQHTQLLRLHRRRVELGNRSQPQLMIDAFVFEIDSAVLSFASKWADDFLCRDCETLIELCSQLGETLASEITRDN